MAASWQTPTSLNWPGLWLQLFRVAMTSTNLALLAFETPNKPYKTATRIRLSFDSLHNNPDHQALQHLGKHLEIDDLDHVPISPLLSLPCQIHPEPDLSLILPTDHSSSQSGGRELPNAAAPRNATSAGAPPSTASLPPTEEKHEQKFLSPSHLHRFGIIMWNTAWWPRTWPSSLYLVPSYLAKTNTLAGAFATPEPQHHGPAGLGPQTLPLY